MNLIDFKKYTKIEKRLQTCKAARYIYLLMYVLFTVMSSLNPTVNKSLYFIILLLEQFS